MSKLKKAIEKAKKERNNVADFVDLKKTNNKSSDLFNNIRNHVLKKVNISYSKTKVIKTDPSILKKNKDSRLQ